MSILVRRALACALSASMAMTPCASVIAQPKPDAKAAKPDTKPDAKAGAKGDTKEGKPTPKKPPTKAEKAKAKAAFTAGDDKFKAGDFAGAAVAFKEAFETIPAPQALYRMALALDKAGKPADALAAYKQFLDAPPPEKMGEQKEAAEARVKELSIATIKLATTPAGASVVIDGQAASGPAPLTLTLKPGPHTIEVSAPSFEPTTRDLVVTPGTTTEVNIALKEVPPPPPPPAASSAPVPEPLASAPPAPPPPPPEEARPSKVPAYVTLGLAGAGAVVGTIFGLKALSAKNSFDSSPTTTNADNAERNALIADMAFGVAITLGITGTVLLLSNKSPEPARTSKFRVLPVLGPQTQGAAAVLRF